MLVMTLNELFTSVRPGLSARKATFYNMQDSNVAHHGSARVPKEEQIARNAR